MYEIHYNNISIGYTLLERADPPMGFVHGTFVTNNNYKEHKLEILNNFNELVVTIKNTAKVLPTEAITIEDSSDEFEDEAIEITILMKTSEDFELYFKHHNEAYDKQFN